MKGSEISAPSSPNTLFKGLWILNKILSIKVSPAVHCYLYKNTDNLCNLKFLGTLIFPEIKKKIFSQTKKAKICNLVRNSI